MNFPKLDTKATKRMCITDFPLTENTEFTDDGVATRPAVYLTGGTLGTVNITRANEFTLSDAVIFNDNEYSRLCVQYEALGSYSYRYTFKLLSASGSVSQAGTIEYSVGSDNVIRMPKSILCFSAKCVKGAGVFAFINLQVSTAENYIFEVYELSSDFSEWLKVGADEMYIPTCLLNGQGDWSSQSEGKLADPEYPETPNLLNGIANCYFTTDSYSTNFYLPIKSATGKDEHIRAELVADTQTTLSFSFPKNIHVSNTVEYNGYSVYLTYNADFICVRSTPSGYVPQRIYGRDNNLRVTVKHETVEQYTKKAYMSRCLVASLGSNGSQVVLTGNSKHPSLTLISHPDNPLYFPESLAVSVGKDGSAVTAAAPLKKSLLLFSADGIYKAEIKTDTYSLSEFPDNIGCRFGNTVASTDKGVIFLGNDNKFYAVSDSGSVKGIGDKINGTVPPLYSTSVIFTVASKNRYMLFADNSVFVLDLKRSDASLNKPVWSRWVLPSDLGLVGGIQFGSSALLICAAATDTTEEYYLTRLSKTDADYYYTRRSTLSERKKVPITVKIGSPLYTPDNQFSLKLIKKASLYAFSKGNCGVSFIDDNGAILRQTSINISCEDDTPKYVNLYPLVHARRCSLELTGEGFFTLQGINLEYYEMSE